MTDKTFHEIEYEAWSARASQYNDLFSPISMQAMDGLLDSLEPLPGKRHLDVACGPGHLVAAASARGAASEGLDFSEPMIALARATHPQACFRVADAAHLPHENQAVDAITCAFGLNHMETPQAAVTEAYRVLRPGGRFAFTLWFGGEAHDSLDQIMKTAFVRHLKERPKFPEAWVQMRYADESACEAITRQAGFGVPVFTTLPIVWYPESARQVVDILDKLSIRTKLFLDRQPPEIRHQIHETILAEAEARRINGVLSLAWPALLTVVQKPH